MVAAATDCSHVLHGESITDQASPRTPTQRTVAMCPCERSYVLMHDCIVATGWCSTQLGSPDHLINCVG